MASTYLSRTPSTGVNRRTFTFSAWIKKSSTDSAVRRLIELYNASTYYVSFRFRDDSSSRLDFYSESNGAGVNLRTNRSFRDLSAWYHIVLSVDTTLATADDRMKMYVNGVQETSFALRTNPSLNENLNFNNSGNGQYIARAVGTETDRMFDGSMTHIHFIDGLAYDADTFGETDATTGIWKPKTAPSVTYGTNGFFLKGENSGALGTDSSGNANNFTVNGTPTQTIDTPSNVFATLNPLANNIVTLSDGNTKLTNGTVDFKGSISTLAPTIGKWYFETYIGALGNSSQIGIVDITQYLLATENYPGNPTRGYSYDQVGNVYNNATSSAYGSTFTTADIIGVAFDLENNKVYFSINGTWQNSADPASNTGGYSITGGYEYTPSISSNNGNVSINFGNGYFGTTAVASATTDESGLGIFEYTVPTGYYALCTKNINEQEYS